MPTPRPAPAPGPRRPGTRHLLAAALCAQFALLALAPAHAELRVEQVRALPPLPASYEQEPSLDARLAWLQQRLAQTQDPAERYRTLRLRFDEYFLAYRLSEAAPLCRQNPPLREDFVYRERCLLATLQSEDEQVPALLALATEARTLGKPAAAAEVLSGLAWRQSQAGDIAGAFENFEAALSLVPAENVQLLSDLMMDTAASYIVNGDEAYIRKGIALLANAREQMERALNDPADRSDKDMLRDAILLSEFNRGIAYVLHLGDYTRALEHFDRVNAEPSAYRASALSFAALAAAELGEHERARRYVARATREPAGDFSPTVQQYLSCYRDLAQRHWQPGHSLASCLNLKPDTTTEVQLDVYKRLSRSEDPAIALAGLRGLKTLFLDKLEPQLRRRGSQAASKAELARLQRESELKSVVLRQQAELQRERDATHTQRQQFFIALSLLLGAVLLLIGLQWRAKKKLAEQFEHLSLVDSLTQLGNRRYLEQHIGRELAHLQRARRSNPAASLGLYVFDVDHFKSINDRHGHGVGDKVLVTLSRRVQAITRETDLLVRWGGEEFLLLARLDCPERCAQIAARLLQAVNGTPFAVGAAEPIPVTCTIGAVRLPFIEAADAPAWTNLVALADLALYEGKARGRNRWVLVNNQALRDAEGLAQALQRPLQQSVAEGLVELSTG
ncbi:GGDEF domain-containing protein [Inhella proteolytica]|uniref:diguanylate cyclase n=1 Tax=Inhella proteolytica TaxID=2795029 RepID=A0A931NG23_9BURK|nr:GGDEF domain-containing protein [Inhella proteolytica]MBH9576243.1 GGDEF domain-containing protein [Inhella proteolytica]